MITSKFVYHRRTTKFPFPTHLNISQQRIINLNVNHSNKQCCNNIIKMFHFLWVFFWLSRRLEWFCLLRQPWELVKYTWEIQKKIHRWIMIFKNWYDKNRLSKERKKKRENWGECYPTVTASLYEILSGHTWPNSWPWSWLLLTIGQNFNPSSNGQKNNNQTNMFNWKIFNFMKEFQVCDIFNEINKSIAKNDSSLIYSWHNRTLNPMKD